MATNDVECAPLDERGLRGFQYVCFWCDRDRQRGRRQCPLRAVASLTSTGEVRRAAVAWFTVTRNFAADNCRMLAPKVHDLDERAVRQPRGRLGSQLRPARF